jgi:beta-phosphoglucomutase-like phosphatase (HAD superfamily)
VTADDGADDTDRGLVVVDIDGVVADVSHRLVHLRAQPRDWDAFFAAMADDPLLSEGEAVANRAARDHDLAWITGRPARYADVTARWLRAHRLPEGPVHHRRDADRRPADVVKLHTVRRLAHSRRVVLVVDDDPTVCTALRNAGFGVFQAGWAPDDDDRWGALHAAQQQDGRT